MIPMKEGLIHSSHLYDSFYITYIHTYDTFITYSSGVNGKIKFIYFFFIIITKHLMI